MKNWIIAFGLTMLLPVSTDARAAQPGIIGLWINPAGSVAVRTAPCDDGLCGSIVWANAKALRDARDSGVPRLLGTELLQDYRPATSGQWWGKVYVPDMGRRFSSTITQSGPDRLRIKGCLFGGMICKAQNWQRIAQLPHG